METLFRIGNTVPFTGEFRNNAGDLTDSSTTVTVRLFGLDQVQIGSDITTTTHVSTGLYRLDYVIPDDSPDVVIIEFNGTIDGVPTAGRLQYSVRWV
jgi:hypothetical protein